MASTPKQLISIKKVSAPPPKINPVKRPVDPYLWATILVIIFISFIRFRLSTIPLERDEGEYAYMGNLILNGLLPYREAYNMKLPGTYFMYAIIMAIFGKTAAGIHTGFLLMNAATMFIFFLAFRRLYSSSIGFFASAVYGLMAIGGSFLGFAAHATHFVTFFVALGVFFIATFYSRHSFYVAFLTGLMFGLSFLMKQQAVFFIAFGGIATLTPLFFRRPVPIAAILKHGTVYALGSALPYTTVVVFYKWVGEFDRFWFWTFQYAGKYASGLPLKQGKIEFKLSFVPMWIEFGFLWVLFLIGLLLLFLSQFNMKQKLLAACLSFFAFLSICPGFYFRQHYFVSLLPAVGLLSAIGLSTIFSFMAQSLKMKTLSYLLPVIFTLCFITVLAQNKGYFLQDDPEELSKQFYGPNPFVESVEIADFIKQNSSPGDKLAVIGSEPQIYVYADRLAATGYLYTYPLVENHSYNIRMQEEMIAEIEKAKPKFIAFCNVRFSWLTHPKAPKLIFQWADQYTAAHYELVGFIDQVNQEQTIYKWNEESRNYQPVGADFIKVYRRK